MMAFSELVKFRRSVFNFQDKKVNFQEVESILDLANMAPNHHLTQPWQFLWIGDETKTVLASIYSQARALKKVGAMSPLYEQEVMRAKEKFMTTPAILIVACRVDEDALVAEEDYAATCCAIQNLLLGVTDIGLGAQWSTHPMIRNTEVKSVLGMDDDQRLVAMIYMGYPAVIPPAPPRKPSQAFVRCLP